MNTYKYIWDPVKNKNVNTASERGADLLKKYIGALKGGQARPNQTNPLRGRAPDKLKFPRCTNYFIPKKSAKTIKKQYKTTFNPDAACPPSLLKHKNNKVVRDKFGRWVPEDWNFKSSLSMQSIIDDDFKCKNKRGCKKKHDKSSKCIACLNQKITYFEGKTDNRGISKERIKGYKKMIERVNEMKEYLEDINIKNNAVLSN